MARLLRFLVAVLACLACTSAALSQPRVDALGDPLPEGAIARLGTTRLRHFNSPDQWCSGVGCIAWSPDGRMIATTSEYGSDIGIEAKLWEAATGKQLSVLENNLRYGPSMARFAPDGKTLAAAARDRIVLWDTATGKELGQLLGHQGDVDSFVFQDGGTTIVSVSRDGVVCWWDVAGRKAVRQWRLLADDPRKTDKGELILSRGVRRACFSPDGKKLALGKWQATQPHEKYPDAIEIVFDLSARKEVWRHDVPNYFCGFAFTPDGKRFVRSGARSVELRDAATGRRLSDPLDLRDEGMDFSPDGKTLAIGVGGAVVFWSPDETVPARRRKLVNYYSYANTSSAGPAFSPDGKKVAVAIKTAIQILDVAAGKPVVSWPSYDEGFTDLAFSADGRTLFADHLAFDAATWRQRKEAEFPWDKFKDVHALSLDRTICVADDGKGKDAVVEVNTGRVIARLQAPAREPGLHMGFFSPKGSLYVMQDRLCANKEVDTVFAIPTGKRLWQVQFDMHGGTDGWTFSADESRAAFFDHCAETIQVRDTATGKLVVQFGKYPGSVAMALSPNGAMLAIWEDGSRHVQIRDLRTAKIHRSLALEQDARFGDHACFRWSPDGRSLAVGGLDDSVRLWESASGQVRREFRGHLARARCLAFSPDAKTLASTSEDTTILLWDVADVGVVEERELATAWQDLAGDAAAAYKAMAAMRQSRSQGVDFLRVHLRAEETPKKELLMRWLKDLDDEDFAVREQAAKELEKRGEAILPSLRKALAASPSAEARRRLTHLVETAEEGRWSSEGLRALRAIEVLERIGSAEARRALETMAGGAPEGRLSQEAKASLTRLRR
jgi:WD40 repeat protein